MQFDERYNYPGSYHRCLSDGRIGKWTRQGFRIGSAGDVIDYRASTSHGKYDSGMAELLDILGLDYCDEDAGSVEWDVHVMRFGKRLLFTDDRGFVWCEKRTTEAEAKEAFEKVETAYGEWADETDDADDVVDSLCATHQMPHVTGGFECELLAQDLLYGDGDAFGNDGMCQ